MGALIVSEKLACCSARARGKLRAGIYKPKFAFYDQFSVIITTRARAWFATDFKRRNVSQLFRSAYI